MSPAETLSIDGYEILETVGAGRMGTVYRARQVALDREVAVKVLHPSLAERDDFAETFRREGRAVAQLSHPNIVAGIDMGEAGDRWYLVMEFLHGGTLGDRLDDEGPLDEEPAVRHLAAMAAALAHANDLGLIHCDIKPENIMLNARGEAVLTDLGIAQMAGEAGGGERVVRGTPHYISPDQIRGLAPLDSRTDIYSLGATFYHLLAGEAPFEGENSKEIALLRLRRPVPDLRAAAPVSAGLAQLIGEMMAVEREDRPADPHALLVRMEELGVGSRETRRLRRRSESVRKGSPGPRSGSGAAPDTDKQEAPQPRGPKRKSSVRKRGSSNAAKASEAKPPRSRKPAGDDKAAASTRKRSRPSTAKRNKASERQNGRKRRAAGDTACTDEAAEAGSVGRSRTGLIVALCLLVGMGVAGAVVWWLAS